MEVSCCMSCDRISVAAPTSYSSVYKSMTLGVLFCYVHDVCNSYFVAPYIVVDIRHFKDAVLINVLSLIFGNIL